MCWIKTYTGRKFDLLQPDPAQVDIRDIAHALGRVCRFAGHTHEFYSVAQHSVLVSRVCAPEDALYALLHDAAEAYIGDMTRPLKLALPAYALIERRIERAVWRGLGLAAPTAEQHARIKHWDNALLATEARDLFPPSIDDWTDALPQPLPGRLGRVLDPRQASYAFLCRLAEICDDCEQAPEVIRHALEKFSAEQGDEARRQLGQFCGM